MEKYYRDLLYELKFKLRKKSSKFWSRNKNISRRLGSIDNKSNQHSTKYYYEQRRDIDAWLCCYLVCYRSRWTLRECKCMCLSGQQLDSIWSRRRSCRPPLSHSFELNWTHHRVEQRVVLCWKRDAIATPANSSSPVRQAVVNNRQRRQVYVSGVRTHVFSSVQAGDFRRNSVAHSSPARELPCDTVSAWKSNTTNINQSSSTLATTKQKHTQTHTTKITRQKSHQKVPNHKFSVLGVSVKRECAQTKPKQSLELVNRDWHQEANINCYHCYPWKGNLRPP